MSEKPEDRELQNRIKITLSPHPRSNKMCVFKLDIDGWVSDVQFGADRGWIHDIFLLFIYKLGTYRNLVYFSKEGNPFTGARLYPPNFVMYFPKDKVRVLNALRSAKVKDRNRLQDLFQKDMDKFMEEAVLIGISEGLGSRPT